MKNTKSKIVIPALGLILLSTAASISGSVAWFTANRTAKIDAGNFAVVNTNGNLACSMSNGVGVEVADTNNGNTHTVTADPTAAVLTDSSLDATVSAYNIVVPDDSRNNVEKIVALANINSSNNNVRETNGSKQTLSVFAWDITFTVTFPSADSKDLGLFFNLEKSWAATKNTYTNEDGNAPASTYYTDPDFAANHAIAADTALSGTLYKKAPKTGYVAPTGTEGQEGYNAGNPGSTAYGFRMAFVPKAIGANNSANVKVWSPFRDSSDACGCSFIDDSDTMATSLASSTPVAMPAGTAYSGNVLMDASENAAVPANGTKTNGATSTSNAAVDCINYLGTFKGGAAGTSTITYTCVVWYEGTDVSINPDARTFETVLTSLEFGVSDLNNAA